MSMSVKEQGNILIIAGVLVALVSSVMWMWAWSEDWNALYTVMSALVSGAALTCIGFGAAKHF